MKNNTMMRFAALAAALTMTFSSVTSCSEKSEGGSKSKNKNSQSQSVDAKELLANSFKSIPIDVDEEIEEVNNFFRIPTTDNLVFTSYDTETRIPSLYVSNLDLSDIKKIDVDLGENGENTEIYYTVTVTSNGSICMLASISDYGDFELPDYDDPDFDYENFDYEAMEEAKSVKYMLYCFDKDGKKVSEAEITDYDEYTSADAKELYVESVTACGDSKIAIHLYGEEESIVIVNTDGKIESKLNTDDMAYIMGMGIAADGSLAVCASGPKGTSINFFDTSTLKATGKKIDIEQGNFYGQTSLIAGTGDYVLYMSSGSSYSGVKEDGTIDEIINYVDADLSQNGVNYIVPIEDEFLVYSNDYSENSGFFRLAKRDASELDNLKVVTVGTLYDDYTVAQKIKDFNKSHDDIRLKAVSYAKYDEYDEENNKLINSASKQLKMDIVSGKAPDMIVSYDTSLISSLANKDVYADLYEFMDKDEELGRDDIIPNILTIGEHNGKLLSISPTFSLLTYAAKTKFCDKENWTFEDMKEIYEKNKDKMSLLSSDSKEQIFSLLFNAAGNFVDYDKSSCSFDSDSFVNMLEFCDQFPKEEDIFDWDNASDKEAMEYNDKMQSATLDEKALISDIYLSEFRGYTQTKHGSFGGDDITLVGLPSADGKGARILLEQSFAILDSSPNKEECWKFIKDFFLSTSYDDQSVWGFPSVKSAFDKKADEAMNKPYYINEKGEKQEYEDTVIRGDKEIKIPPLTKEEKEYIVNYVSSADAVFNTFSDDISMILQEEVMAFFNGEKTAKAAADVIQNKVSLLLSEQS